MGDIRIIGTGSYVPPRILHNNDLQQMGLDTTDKWIYERTGVRERRVAEPDVATSDLAYEASLKAIESARLAVDQIDLIIVGTITPDTCCPSAANWLQAKLDAPQAISFDVTAACSGYIFALDVAARYLETGAAKNVLVVASEVMTRTLNWEDRNTCILWGDGAGAAVLTTGDEGPVLLSTCIHTDGKNGQNLLLPGGGSATTPISAESLAEGRHYLNMIGANFSFRVAIRRFTEAIQEAAADNNVAVTDIDWFIPHQANIRMFQSIAKSQKIDIEKFYLTIHKYGNISSASCAIALDEAVRDGSIQKGHLVCLPVFGGGLTWGAAMIKW